MTLTKSRCEGLGYWISTKGGWLSTDEMMALQGLSVVNCDWQGADVTDFQFRGCLGNTMSLNGLCFLMPEALAASQLVTPKNTNQLRKNAAPLFPGLG